MALSLELVDALKRFLRAQDLTYRDLAARLKLSEAAVKRMFSKRAMSLERLEQICDVLDIGLAELSAEAARGRTAMAELSEAQEQALVDEPALLLALFLTLNRWKQTDVQRHFVFDDAQWTRLLVRLDRLGIIELMPGNRGRPLTARNFRWRADGPMERYFRLNLLGDFFADPFDGEQDVLLLLSGSLSIAGIRQLKQRLGEVAREFDALLARDAALSAQERVGVSLVLAQKPWLLQLFHPYRRSQ
ncbi:helix-turn-helix transcriptional regulator [Lysobacter sp. 5GHs7-4]|uniref:helix-turn-helix domain-containing protein n=1 Tax=Lysobacter sp. 5GHs7-4 TaxID=2904253 RepID=UPI0017A250CB|nr:helix-turn-helix transcriptional regulator [Lysobacter sp. 5GHs7-4]NUO77374.1 helix-turn-helix transcriptional regulator [Lysobacter sp.]UHQ24340.1 helix-turn-helix transcriptional regulator [Lysobacter sp. 5GHs7-4]